MTASHPSSRPRDRFSPARLVQDDIRTLETSIDGAIADGGDLIARMMRVGQVAGLAPHYGQKAIEAAAACLNAGILMRAHVADAHEELRSIAGTIRVRELGWGDLVDSPSSSKLSTPSPVRLVDGQ